MKLVSLSYQIGFFALSAMAEATPVYQGSQTTGYLHVREGYDRFGKLEKVESSCTATLLSPTIAITAAHCVSEFPANRIEFTLDAHPDVNQYPSYAQVTEYRIHPDYFQASDLGQNDVAILQLGYGNYGRKLTRFPRIASAQLALETKPVLEAVGYGVRIDYQSVFKRVIQLLQSDVEFSPQASGLILHPSQKGEVICHGDSGGPLFARGSQEDTIIGILSGGDFRQGEPRCAVNAIYTPLSEELFRWASYQWQQLRGPGEVFAEARVTKRRPAAVFGRSLTSKPISAVEEAEEKPMDRLSKQRDALLQSLRENEFQQWKLALTAERKAFLTGHFSEGKDEFTVIKEYFLVHVWPEKIDEIRGRLLK